MNTTSICLHVLGAGMKVSSSVLQQCVAAQALHQDPDYSGIAPDPWIMAAFGGEAALNPTAQSVWTGQIHSNVCTA